MKDSFYFSIISLIIFSSCNTEPTVVVSKNKKTPVSIARNFTMTYTDSTLTKSFVSGKVHYDYTNDELNFSEFFEDVELIIYDINKTSTISSDYAIVYNSFRFMEFKGNVKSYENYLSEISKKGLPYDSDNWNDAELPAFIEKAYNRFKLKAEEIGLVSDTTLVIQSENIRFSLQVDKQPRIMTEIDTVDVPFVKISVDHNLLHRLLRGPKFAHWNNAEIGSLYFTRRKPLDDFSRAVQTFLIFFVIA